MSSSNQKPPNEKFGMIIGLIIGVGASIVFDSIPIGIVVGVVIGTMSSFYSRKPKEEK